MKRLFLTLALLLVSCSDSSVPTKKAGGNGVRRVSSDGNITFYSKPGYTSMEGTFQDPRLNRSFQGKAEIFESHEIHGRVMIVDTDNNGDHFVAYDGYREHKLDGNVDYIESTFGNYNIGDDRDAQEGNIGDIYRNINVGVSNLRDFAESEFGYKIKLED